MLLGLGVVGIALAGGAVYLAKDQIAQYQYANAQAQAALARVVPTVTVYVADGPLKYGQKLTPEDVRAVKWPEDAIPEGAFLGLPQLQGRTPAWRLLPPRRFRAWRAGRTRDPHPAGRERGRPLVRHTRRLPRSGRG